MQEIDPVAEITLRELSFGQIASVWQEKLWPDRRSPIEDKSYLSFDLQVDMTIQNYKPRFWGLYWGDHLVGVNSGHSTSPTHFRSRGLWVDPNYRRRGLAQNLLSAAAECAHLMGHPVVWSLARSESVPVYQKYGFSIERKVDGFEYGPHYLVKYSQHVACKEKRSVATLNMDAWSDGQVASRLWLCDELFPIMRKVSSDPVVAWILAGWYGILPFLMLSKAPELFRHIRLFELDSEAACMADRINNCWEFNGWKFKAFLQDCNLLEYSTHPLYGPPPQVVINTACEHFLNNAWFDRIPKGCLVALQSNNMDHRDGPTSNVRSIQEMISRYPLTQVLYAGEKNFTYPNLQFTRFMVIGMK